MALMARSTRFVDASNGTALDIGHGPSKCSRMCAARSRMSVCCVRALRDQVAPNLFRGFDERAFPATSMPALRLEAWARRQSVGAGERVSLALRDAMFEHGRDIADAEVLREIAARCGVDVPLAESDNDVIADWRDGEHRGVVGSPHFFAAEGNWFCPSLTITHSGSGLRMADNRDGFDRFAAMCLDGDRASLTAERPSGHVVAGADARARAGVESVEQVGRGRDERRHRLRGPLDVVRRSATDGGLDVVEGGPHGVHLRPDVVARRFPYGSEVVGDGLDCRGESVRPVGDEVHIDQRLDRVT